jgi:hypothetical protein
MPVKLDHVRSLLIFVFVLPWTIASYGQAAPSPSQAQALVHRTLSTELRAAQDTSHPMRYRLRKFSPRLTSTKEILETRDGDVARLVAVFDKPLSPADDQTEQARLDALAGDPTRQRHRKQNEEEDAGIVFKLLRMLPKAFVYQYAGLGEGSSGTVQKFTFKPSPGFIPPDIETQALTSMTGEIWIDAVQERVVRLEGHLQQDTDYGWGILGKLNKGGWIEIEQGDVGNRQWRIVRLRMQMSLRVLFKNKSFDTVEEMTQYAPLPPGLSYVQAIQMLRGAPGPIAHGNR